MCIYKIHLAARTFGEEPRPVHNPPTTASSSLHFPICLLFHGARGSAELSLHQFVLTPKRVSGMILRGILFNLFYFLLGGG